MHCLILSLKLKFSVTIISNLYPMPNTVSGPELVFNKYLLRPKPANE